MYSKLTIKNKNSSNSALVPPKIQTCLQPLVCPSLHHHLPCSTCLPVQWSAVQYMVQWGVCHLPYSANLSSYQYSCTHSNTYIMREEDLLQSGNKYVKSIVVKSRHVVLESNNGLSWPPSRVSWQSELTLMCPTHWPNFTLLLQKSLEFQLAWHNMAWNSIVWVSFNT